MNKKIHKNSSKLKNFLNIKELVQKTNIPKIIKANPINSAKKIAKELRLRGEIDRGYSTGLVVQSITKSIARYLSLPFLNGVIIKEKTLCQLLSRQQ